MKSTIFLLISTILITTSCTTVKKSPTEGYDGPKATIIDSYTRESTSKAAMFVAEEIDGAPIDTSISASMRASHGKGRQLSTIAGHREVPIRTLKIKIVGRHITAAPIDAIFNELKGKMQSINGTVEITPKPDTRYVVRGQLKENECSIWIEEEKTKEIITKIISKSNCN